MKIFGTNKSEVSQYTLDFFSFLHIASGILSYFIGFWLFGMFMSEILAIFLTYICLFIGGIVWEIVENTLLINNIKMFQKYDSPLNSQVDVLLVFLGGIIGTYCYNLDWMFNIILLGLLVVAFTISKYFTFRNRKKSKKTKKTKKN